MGTRTATSLRLRVAAVAGFVLVAALGSFATSSGSARAGAALTAALLSLGPAVLFGVLLSGLARVLTPPLAAAAERMSLQRFVERDRQAPREPVIMLHASMIGIGSWLLSMAFASKLLLLRLRSIESVELRESLSVIGVAVLAVGTALLAVAATWLARSWLQALDRRIALPVPASAALRTIVWLGLPLCVLGVASLYVMEPVLGPVAMPLWLLPVFGATIALYAVLPESLAARTRLHRYEWAVLVALVVLGSWGADRVLASSAAIKRALGSARPGSALLIAARRLSDVDGDGASALFGERDCAALSSRRGPTLREIAGNGVDEDCDGADGQRSDSLPTSPRFFGGLRKQDIKSYDIVWFVVDAVRADHTSLLGYDRPTTPHLDDLAGESLVFSNAYSQSSATMLSFPSMLTGIDPGRLNWARETKRLQVDKSQRRYISDMLASKRYKTGFVAAPYIKGMLPGLLTGWSWVGIASRDQKTSSSTAAALASSFIVRAREKRAPFLLVTYMAAPHGPYSTHGPSYPKLPKNGDRDRYDVEIMNADRYIGFVLDVLRADPERWRRTIVVVTSDHGEEFREHGGTNHARTCHVESLHVPLLVRIPGQPAARVEQPVGLVDIVPTLLELTGTTNEASSDLEGSSLLISTYAAERLTQDRPVFCSVVSQKAIQGDFARRSVQSGKWKLMVELRGNKEVQLYDTEADPKEKAPVAIEGERARIAKRLGGWLNVQLTGNVHKIDMSE